jgi:hypothetical protein
LGENWKCEDNQVINFSNGDVLLLKIMFSFFPKSVYVEVDFLLKVLYVDAVRCLLAA